MDTIADLEKYEQLVIGGLKGRSQEAVDKCLQVALKIKENVADDLFANDSESRKKVSGSVSYRF